MLKQFGSLLLLLSTYCYYSLWVRSIVCWVVVRPQLLQVLIGLFELPQDTTATSDDIPLIDPDADNAGNIYTFFVHYLLFRWRKVEARSLVRVSALCSLQCFDTDGEVAGRTSCPIKNPVPLIPRRSVSERRRRNQEGIGWPRLIWKMADKWK